MSGPGSSLRFDGWIPFRLYRQGGEPGVEWLYMGSNRFTEPFFETTIYFEAQTPFNSLFRFRTPWSALAEWQAVSPGLKPTGFIFHLSRCGSTLITQMLASLPRNLVLSEPGVLDRMLRASDHSKSISMLQCLVSALSQPRTGAERHLFIKFDPHTIADFALLRSAFPDVPSIFVYRNPVEVLVSNTRGASPLVTQGILGPDFLNLDASQVATMNEDEYAARVLGKVAESAASLAASRQVRLVEYRQLPDIVWSELGRRFGVDFTGPEVERLKQVATLDAKHPKQRFESDSELKKRDATDAIRRLAEEWIMPHYARLEEIRLAQASWSVSVEQASWPVFRQLVLDDPALFEKLRGLDRDQFLERAVQMAREAGINLHKADLERALADARTERYQRLL